MISSQVTGTIAGEDTGGIKIDQVSGQAGRMLETLDGLRKAGKLLGELGETAKCVHTCLTNLVVECTFIQGYVQQLLSVPVTVWMLVFALLITDFSTVRQKARVFLLIGTLINSYNDSSYSVWMLMCVCTCLCSEHVQMFLSPQRVHPAGAVTSSRQSFRFHVVRLTGAGEVRVPSKWKGRSTTGGRDMSDPPHWLAWFVLRRERQFSQARSLGMPRLEQIKGMLLEEGVGLTQQGEQNLRVLVGGSG